MSDRAPLPLNVTIHVTIPRALRADLEAEAWEENLTLSKYVAGLLSRRGKWARSQRYDIVAAPRGRGG